MDLTADVKRAKEEISELEDVSEEISRIKNRRKKRMKIQKKGSKEVMHVIGILKEGAKAI